jgi:hypothetical protein
MAISGKSQNCKLLIFIRLVVQIWTVCLRNCLTHAFKYFGNQKSGALIWCNF